MVIGIMDWRMKMYKAMMKMKWRLIVIDQDYNYNHYHYHHMLVTSGLIDIFGNVDRVCA